MKNKKILITSYHSSLNNGDRALLEMNIIHLKEAFKTENISVAVNWPEELYFRQPKNFKVVTSPWNVIGIQPKNPFLYQLINTLKGMVYAQLYRKGIRATIPAIWRDVFNSYETSDIIASVSSTLFYSTGRFGWPFPVKTWTIELAHIFNKPFMVLPQSIGPLRWKWEEKLLSSVYNKSFLILLRDRESIKLAQSIGFSTTKVKFAPDPTFAFKEEEAEVAISLLKEYGYQKNGLSIGLTLIPWQGRWVNSEIMENYYFELVEFIKQFNRSFNGKLYLFNQVTGPTELDDDRIAATQLLERLNRSGERIIYVDRVLSPEQLKACYGQMSLFIATRMHSGIFALGMGVPVLYIGYLQKTRGIMEWLDLLDWVIDLDEVNHKVLLEKTNQAIKELALRKEIVRQKLPQIMADINYTPELIRKAYYDAFGK